jgi:hypothetical protein
MSKSELAVPTRNLRAILLYMQHSSQPLDFALDLFESLNGTDLRQLDTSGSNAPDSYLIVDTYNLSIRDYNAFARRTIELYRNEMNTRLSGCAVVVQTLRVQVPRGGMESVVLCSFFSTSKAPAVFLLQGAQAFTLV